MGVTSCTLVSLLVVCFVFARHGALSNPRTYREGESVELKMNALTSHKTLLPLDSDSLPPIYGSSGRSKKRKIWTFLKRSMSGNENLGEYLNGDRINSRSPYSLRMKQDMYCEQLCVQSVDPWSGFLVEAIRNKYHTNWIADNLPAAAKMEDDNIVTTRYWGGAPIGFINEHDGKAYVNNHVNIEIKYSQLDNEIGEYRVVGFMVQPFSIHHDVQQLKQPEEPKYCYQYYDSKPVYSIHNPIASCNPNITKELRQHTSYNMVVDASQKAQEASGLILFTYDVIWIESDVPWATRWDIYTSMDQAIPSSVHWLPIGWSIFYVLALSVLVVLLLMRNVQASSLVDDVEINEDEIQESLNDKGYALVHVDDFHPPNNNILLLAVFSGTGAHILSCFIITTIAAALRVLHPSERGRFVTFALVAFQLCGFVNGFVTVQTMKLFQTAQNWAACGLVSSFFFPGITLVLFLGQELIAFVHRSTLVMPFIVILFLLTLWLVILVPSTCLGAYIGHMIVRSAQLPTSPRTVLLGVASYRSIQNGDRVIKCLCVLFCLIFNVGWLVIGLFWLLRSYMVQKGVWRPDFNGVGAILVGGLVCFGSIYVEVYYIMSSVWVEYYYESFGFLLFAAVVFFWTCGVVSVLFNYIHLIVETSHSWWWQFLCSGAAGFWLALYSIGYWFQLGVASFSSLLLYMGFMAWASFAVFLMSGTVGFLCSFLFVRQIFSIGMAGKTILEQQEPGIDLMATTDPTSHLIVADNNSDEVATSTDQNKPVFPEMA